MGRRNFIRTLLGLGISTTMLPVFSRRGLAELEFDPETEVPRIHGYRHTNHESVIRGAEPPEREPVYEIIPREKWRLVEAADDVRNRVKRRLTDLDPTPLVGVRIPEGMDDFSHRTVVVKHVTEVSTSGGQPRVINSPSYSPTELEEIVKTRFPDEMSGTAGRDTPGAATVDEVPIETETVRLGRNGYYDYEYRSDGVPGGCAIEGDGGGRGTLGAFVFDGDTYNFSYVTAGHVVRYSEEVYQNDRGVSGDHLATVNDYKIRIEQSFDVAVLWGVEISGSWQFAADAPDSYHGPSITGAQSRQGLLDMQGTNKEMYKQGITTGLQSATIYDVYETSYDANHNGKDGDSGGPHWVEKSGDALLSGIHRGPRDVYLDDPVGSHATIMESIEKEYNLTA